MYKIRLPSFSRIDTFTRCPRQYAENMFVDFKENTAMKRGTHIHNCLEAAAKIVLEGKSWAAACVAITDTPGEIPIGELYTYMDRAAIICESLIPVKGGVEAWFNDVGPACGLPSLPIRGKIDLISETALKTSEQARAFGVIDGPAVVDYKTISGEHRIKNAWEVKRSMQLKIYSLATGLDRAGFIYFPPKSEARALFVHYTEDDLRIAHNWLTKTLANMDMCWKIFFNDPDCGVGSEVTQEQVDAGNWDAWGLSSPDNMLCSKKWCDVYGRCIGAKS